MNHDFEKVKGITRKNLESQMSMFDFVDKEASLKVAKGAHRIKT